LNRWATWGEWIFSRRIDDEFARAWRWARRRPVLLFVSLGVICRVVVYLQNRGFWMDESSLWGNVAGTPAFDFSEPLKGHQLAPHLFLVAERAIVFLLGRSRYVARSVPLLGGILALLLFPRLVRHTSSPRAGLVALFLFAFSDDLIYYSSEFKPYSLDLAIGLLASVAALDALASPLTKTRVGALLLAALLAPW
jgi:predicted membrane-bound mannosyltransferase